MIEATKRRSPAPSGSAMRRLMTRPIHAHLAVVAQPRTIPAEPAADMAPEAAAQVTADAPGEHPASPSSEAGTATGEADLTRLRLEVAMMKAALAAERRESEALRASLGLAASESLGDEARAVRERWAALVERLIHDSL
ncbi:hypothetical protein [Methylorubrum thiocyanatum]|uniref:Uncharacterized protein n=1 Tax=Methylorubrum thiocyanatum TaxID=47958 RepID=A0AA40RYU7_9HYPH|nr:hypothetical protein [Methylorubrum thiocyanatum]MBA8911344.1 hypothetical protein [Methylorubrum thiocyanatum]GJE82642.1 hypothetical protein CJNNKLLH_4008 [Methylorubrum thiocyanatum]